MWSRFNPQRDELLSLCQEAGEQESRVLLMAVSWERAALPGPWAGALAWPEATPSCQPGRGSAWGALRYGGVSAGSPEHGPLGKAKAKPFPIASRDFTCGSPECPVRFHPSHFMPQWGAEQRDQGGVLCL